MAPLFEYECPRCKNRKMDMRSIPERFDGPECYRGCGAKMKLLVSPVAGIVKNPAVPKRQR